MSFFSCQYIFWSDIKIVSLLFVFFSSVLCIQLYFFVFWFRELHQFSQKTYQIAHAILDFSIGHCVKNGENVISFSILCFNSSC